MAQVDWRERAKQGDLEAMTVLLNRAVIHKHLKLTVQQQGDRLQILAEGEVVPDARGTALLVRRELAAWKTTQIAQVRLLGQQQGREFPSWTQDFEVTAQLQPFRVPSPSPDAGGRRSPLSAKSPQAEPRFKVPSLQFDPLKLGFIGLVAIYGFLGSFDPYNGPFLWLHYPDLAIHETGHLIFMICFGPGSFLHILGGSLTQILFPAGFAIYFFLIGQRYSSALTVFWTGQNFMDVSVYIKDAQARELPLTVDDPEAHDWYNLLTMTDTLQWDQMIGNFIYSIGALIIIASILMGIYYARIVKPNQSPNF